MIPISCCFSPLERCRGTRPTQAANYRPLWKARPSAIAATTAVPITGPTPSTAAIFMAESVAVMDSVNLFFRRSDATFQSAEFFIETG